MYNINMKYKFYLQELERIIENNNSNIDLNFNIAKFSKKSNKKIKNIDQIKENKILFRKIKKLFKKSYKNYFKTFTYSKYLSALMNETYAIEKKKYRRVYNSLFVEAEKNMVYFKNKFKLTKNLSSLFSLKNNDDLALFLYMYSTLDKIATLILYKINNNTDLESLWNVHFHKPETYLTYENDILKNLINIIIESKSFKYIKKTRNIMVHQFNEIDNKYNFSFTLMILFIILSELLIKIHLIYSK